MDMFFLLTFVEPSWEFRKIKIEKIIFRNSTSINTIKLKTKTCVSFSYYKVCSLFHLNPKNKNWFLLIIHGPDNSLIPNVMSKDCPSFAKPASTRITSITYTNPPTLDEYTGRTPTRRLYTGKPRNQTLRPRRLECYPS